MSFNNTNSTLQFSKKERSVDKYFNKRKVNDFVEIIKNNYWFFDTKLMKGEK